LLNFAEVEEVYDFTHDWNDKRKRISQKASGQSVSAEIEFYKTTWVKLEQLDIIIERIPVSHTKVGTIVIETASLKKMLAEMPRLIVESIRTNVTQTIESETKALKEELTATTDTLEKVPSTLNIYVDQVNTLKYLKEKSDDFKNKFNTIITLREQCRQDNIKISIKLSTNIEEVASLYGGIPKLTEKAREGLLMNKN
jgi:flagellar biosynthesis/type III secretory pathway chaperone